MLTTSAPTGVSTRPATLLTPSRLPTLAMTVASGSSLASGSSASGIRSRRRRLGRVVGRDREGGFESDLSGPDRAQHLVGEPELVGAGGRERAPLVEREPLAAVEVLEDEAVPTGPAPQQPLEPRQQSLGV